MFEHQSPVMSEFTQTAQVNISYTSAPLIHSYSQTKLNRMEIRHQVSRVKEKLGSFSAGLL